MPTMTRHRRSAASSQRRRPVVLAVAGLALLLAVAGGACSSSSSSGSTTTTTTATTTATTTRADTEAAVKQTVEGWADAFSRAREDPAGDHRELLRYATADFVRKQQSFFEGLVRDSQRIARPADSKQMFKVLSVTINGSHATARTCFVDDINLIDARSGMVVGRQTGTVTADWLLQHAGKRWQISDTQGAHELRGVKPCPAK